MDATYTAAYSQLYREHWWWRLREQFLLRKIGRLLGGSRDARILDVGCGAGLFFDALQAFGRVEGIESDPIAVEQSGRWRSHIHLGELATFHAEGTYDLILMLDVLEHVQEPEVLLRQSVGLLAPGGGLIVTVPAFDWLWTTHDDLNHHVKRYTAAEMARRVRASGLEVLETRYLFQSLVLPKLFVRTKEALSTPSPSVPRIPGRLLNHGLQTWFRLENVIAGWLPFGTSVVVIGRRANTDAEARR
jgi:2-polyprenyl-3-methyl-5-hydroxy-6-metoxy-1,4-benzoquinol methylase